MISMDRKLWTLPECSACLLNITSDFIDLSFKTESDKIEIYKKVYKILENFNQNSLTFNLANKIIEEIEKNSLIEDPFLELKQLSNKISLKALSIIKTDLKESIKGTSYDSFKNCLIISLVGNTIDFATGGHSFDLNQEYLISLIHESLKKGLAVDDSSELYKKIKNGENKIVYCLDNAGEIVFDKLLIEKMKEMNNEVIAVVKNKPYANDVLLEDAIQVNLTKSCKVISTERFGLGFINENPSEEFLNALNESNLIISKGQNNFETFTFFRENIKTDAVFLFITKCRALSSFLQVPLKSFVVKIDKSRKKK